MVYYNDGIEAKHLPVRNFKKFRTDWVTLGSVTAPRPVLRAALLVDRTLTLVWCSVAGTTYRVQYKSDLNQQHWMDLDGDVLASAAMASKTFPIGPDPQ